MQNTPYCRLTDSIIKRYLSLRYSIRKKLPYFFYLEFLKLGVSDLFPDIFSKNSCAMETILSSCYKFKISNSIVCFNSILMVNLVKIILSFKKSIRNNGMNCFGNFFILFKQAMMKVSVCSKKRFLNIANKCCVSVVFITSQISKRTYFIKTVFVRNLFPRLDSFHITNYTTVLLGSQ